MKNENKEKTSKTIKRYGQLSGSVASLATKLAGEKYLGIKIDREKHASQLLQSIGNLKGPLMKVGQILATIPQALPPEYAKAMQELQSNAPPMSWAFVKRRMKAELGKDWQDKFKSFNKEATAAASLGQVHKAITHDNQEIACKLQYPDMLSAVKADLKQLKLVFNLYEKYDNSISTKLIHQELQERLIEELDYKREAKQCKLFKHILKDEPNIHVPTIIDDLSTDRLLTSTWLHGDKLMNFKEAPIEDRNKLAINMFKTWYVPLYHYGIIHGDPHPGNYTVNKDLSINLLDFGCVRIFPAKFVSSVIDLYKALQNKDKDLAVHAYETWGFKNLTLEQVEILNIWANFLYGPILEDKVRPIGIVKEGIYGRDIAQKVHKKLKETGNITIPREFVFMDRAALGLGSVFLHLKAEINWHNIFNEIINDFNEQDLHARQQEALSKFSL